jgi:hypothetical protein
MFALVDPRKVLELAGELSGDAGRTARSFALQNYASTDPLAALARVEQLPPGGERDQLMGVVAAGYARVDPEGALAWAQSLQPPPANVLFAVLSSLARTDPDRALDIALSMPASRGPSFGPPPTLIVAQLLTNTADPEKIANRVLTVPDRLLREQTLSAMASSWSTKDPAAALRWLVENRERVPPSSLLQAAQQLAASDPTAAASYSSQVPNDLRGAWLASVAAGYAQNDAKGAMSWVAQYQGQPGYEGAVAAIVQRAADYEPATAARLLETMNIASPEYFGAVSSIAYRWGRQSPRDAAQWAAGLNDDAPRRNALSAVLAQWSSSDPAAARAWVLGMPNGNARDAALMPIVMNAASGGETIDHALVDAFSADVPRRQALIQAVGVLARNDQDAARRLADEFLTDPAGQAQARQIIEMVGNGNGEAVGVQGAFPVGVPFPGPIFGGVDALSIGLSSFRPATVAPTAAVPQSVINAAPTARTPAPVLTDPRR